MDEIISISPKGTVLGRMNMSMFPSLRFEYAGQAVNGTIVAYLMDSNWTTYNYIGITEDLRHIWPVENSSKYQQLDEKSKTIGSMTYSFEHRTDNWSNAYTTVCAYNNSDASYSYKTVIFGNFSGPVYYTEGTVYVRDACNAVWAIDQDGRAYCANGSIGWSVYGTYGDGLLLYRPLGLELVGSLGSSEWQYDLNVNYINSIFVEADHTIVVVTSDAIIAIDKPTMTMTMTYLMGLVAFDLLFCLTAGIWILDRRLERP